MAEESSGATMSCTSAAGVAAGATATTQLAEEEMLTDGVETDDAYLPFPGFVPVSLYCLPQTSPPRTLCLRMITNPWFERISMMVILLNCVTLGMYQPCIDEACNTGRCEMLKVFDHLIFAFFAIEMVIKMTAMGITGKKAYLADTWNRLDCFIVVAGLAEYCLDVENMNLSAIRTIRVLRPLRAINRIPSMRILVMLLLDTLPMLGNVLLLCFFVFFIFGIVGVQLWAGTLRQRCFIDVNLLPENVSIPGNLSGFYVERMRVLKPLSSYYQDFEMEKDYICSLPKDGGMHRCDNLPKSRYQGMLCNSSAMSFSSNEPSSNSCINWNQYYTHCRAGEKNPFQGAISFDNIGLAWVAIFLVISLEGWTDIMYYVQDSHSYWDWIYFVLLIVIGSFFMINLCLVVIATQFSETKKREMERMRMERTRYQSTSTLASNSMSEPNSCYHEIIKYLAHLWRRARRKLATRYRNYRRRHGHVPDPEVRPKSITLRRKRKRGRNRKRTRSKTPSGQRRRPRTERRLSSCSGGEDEWRSSSPAAPRASPEVSDIDPMSSPGRPTTILRASHPLALPAPTISSRDSSSGNGSQRYHQHLQPPRLSPNHLAAPVPSVGAGPPPPPSTSNRRLSPHHLTCQELLVLGGTQGAALAASLATGYLVRQERHLSAPQLLFYPLVNPDALYLSPNQRESWSEMESGEGEEMVDDEEEEEEEEEYDDDYDDSHRDWPERLPRKKHRSFCITVCRKFRAIIKALVDHRYFQRGILLAILVNTLSMGIEYHNQPEELTLAVEISNVVFSAIFAFEMLLKLIGEGPYQYISNGFNVFDGVIVILSLIELSQKNEGTSGLSVLRTFRLLRILKLVRFLPALRRQLFVMLRTMDNVAVFFALLILFIFIFSILGMNLFGCKFCRKDKDNNVSCERKNFDSLLWAIVTVFQILTQEDWNVVLFNGMERTSHWAALYFVALMTFGNYVLFNLLVAILVEGFSAERHECEINERRHRERELEDDKKRSRHSLLKEDEDKKDSSDGKDSDPEKVKDCYDDPDPKCNIAKETKLLHRPPAVAITRSEKSESKSGPPIITHTAATPQGSPNATLEPCSRDLSNMLSPVMTIARLSTTPPNPPPSSSSNNTSDKTLNNSHGSSQQVSPSKQLAVVLNDTHSPVPSRRGSLSPTVDPTIRLPSWGRGSLSPSPCRLQRKDSHGSTGSSPRLQRRESRGSICSWRRRNRRRADRETIVDSDTDSDAEADHEVEVLNNSCHLNNCQPGTGPAQEKTKSHCNGGLPIIHGTPNNKRCILTQQNSIKSPPQTPRSTCAGVSSPVNLSPNVSQGPGVSSSPAPLCQSSVVAGIIPGASTAALTLVQGPLSPNHTPLGSNPLSWCPISRQNSTKSSVVGHRDLSPQNSISSGYKPSNLEMVAARSDVGAPSLPLPLPPVNPLPPTAVMPYEEKDCTAGTKICWYFETPTYLIERDSYSLYCFSSENSFRILCTKFAKQKWFDYSVLFFIALNCVTLAMERPNIPPESSERLFLTVANYVFTFVFTLEMAVKVVAFGLWYGHHAYFRSGWNVMDGSLVIISLVDVLMSVYSSNSPRIFGILRVFRLLRSLRPLRVINRAPGLKLVVQTLLSSLRPIGNIVLICCTFFIIFGILGVQLFKGTFYYCDGPHVKFIRNRTECLNDTRNDWLNRKYNFDDLGQALMALFVLSSKDGWVNIMYQGLDAVGVDQQPIENYSEWRLLYFISFLLLVGFFVLNMFVGVVVENFHRCREEQEKEEKARRAEKRMKKMEKRRRRMREPPYYINYSRVRLFIHSIVTSKYFDLAIAAVIGLNVVTMAMEFYMMPEQLIYALEIFNYFFTAVFVLEAAMKMLALGAGRYFSDRWNQLDVMIVMLSVVGIVLEKMESTIIPINPTIIRVMRVLRIARVLKLLKMAKGIRALLDTVMQALPQVGNLGLLFFLLFFIFAALGVELFGRLECDEMNPCQGLGEHAHFRNFGMAFLTLFRVATGDNWNGIMKDTLRDTCDPAAECVRNCCVSAIITPLYFVIFVLMAQFVLVNVVVAVLMKHLEESHKHMEDDLDLDAELERELAAEVDMAVAAAAALENIKEQEEVGREIILFPHKPVYKMASLPANFTFNLRSDDQIDEDSPSTSPSLVNVEVGNRTLLAAPSTPSLGAEDLNNVNIRQASPEEPVDKVAVADLRTIQELANDSPAAPWHAGGSFLQLPVTDCGNGYRHRSLDTDLDQDLIDQDLDLELWSPDGATTGKTEGSSLVPPPYPASSPVGTHIMGTLETSGTYENIRDSIFDEVPARNSASPVLVVVPSRTADLVSVSSSPSLPSLSSSSSSLSSPPPQSPSSSHRLLPLSSASTNGTSCSGSLSEPSRHAGDLVFADDDDDDDSDEEVMVVDPGMNTILCYFSGTSGESEDAPRATEANPRHLPVARCRRNNRLL